MRLFKGIHSAVEWVDNQPARYTQQNQISEGIPVAKAIGEGHYFGRVAGLFKSQGIAALAKIATIGFF